MEKYHQASPVVSLNVKIEEWEIDIKLNTYKEGRLPVTNADLEIANKGKDSYSLCLKHTDVLEPINVVKARFNLEQELFNWKNYKEYKLNWQIVDDLLEIALSPYQKWAAFLREKHKDDPKMAFLDENYKKVEHDKK